MAEDSVHGLARGSRLDVRPGEKETNALDMMQSPSGTREQAHRLDDDLAVLEAERQALQNDAATRRSEDIGRSMHRSRSRRRPLDDDFDAAAHAVHEKPSVYRPPEHPSTAAAKFFKKVHNSSFLVRYFTYIVPVVCVILLPLLLGALVFKRASVGGVRMMWFCVWLEIVWLTLWAGRVSASILSKSRACLALHLAPSPIFLHAP